MPGNDHSDPDSRTQTEKPDVSSARRNSTELFPGLDGRIDLAGRWIPLRPVALALEVGAGDERRLQVFRIVDHGPHQQDDVTVGLGSDPVEVLGDRRVRAVRDAVLPQISFPEVRCRHEKRPAGWCRTAPPASTSAASELRDAVAIDFDGLTGDLPFSRRVPLPGFLARLRRGSGL